MDDKGGWDWGGGCRIGVHAESCVSVVFDQEYLLARRASRAIPSCYSRRPHRYCACRQRLADRPLPRLRHPTPTTSHHHLGPGRCGAAVAQGRHRCVGRGPRQRGLASHCLPGTCTMPWRSSRCGLQTTSLTSWIGSGVETSVLYVWMALWCALTGAQPAPKPAT